MIQPAKMALLKVTKAPGSAAWRPSSMNCSLAPGDKTFVASTAQAKSSVPRMLAAKTMAHSRSTSRTPTQLRPCNRGEHGGESVFREQLLPSQDDDQETEAVAEAADQRTPGLVGKAGAEQSVADHGKSHRQTRRNPDHIREDAGRLVLLTLLSHRLMDDEGARCGNIVDALAFLRVRAGRKGYAGCLS